MSAPNAITSTSVTTSCVGGGAPAVNGARTAAAPEVAAPQMLDTARMSPSTVRARKMSVA
ncbi:hypothetical protein EB73_15555 [Mycobacterium sp. SWH-M3]|nr:hypothetical protein EB73_15555 [Mycobacterium sp. SWH-M3]